MIYILRSDGVYCVYSGMGLDEINSTLTSMGKTGTVIDQTTYEAGIAAQQII